jgi:hypothetical protein
MKALIAAAALILGLGVAAQSADAAAVVVKKVTTVHRVYHRPVVHHVYRRPVVRVVRKTVIRRPVYHRPVVVVRHRTWHSARVCHWAGHRRVCLTTRRFY